MRLCFMTASSKGAIDWGVGPHAIKQLTGANTAPGRLA